MTDYFALLDEPRRPWLEPGQLKEKFLSLSTAIHPDRVHRLGKTERAAAQAQYTELNAAFQCLRDPRDRLRHLIALELGALPDDLQQIPSELMDLSLSIGQACRDADQFLTGKSRAQSPLLKVQFFERSQDWIDRLQALQHHVGRRQETVWERVRSIDAQWLPASPAERSILIEELNGLQRLAGFYARWLAQLQERIVRLAF